MGTLTLTKVGGMTVKWKKAGVQGAPLLPSSASFDPTAYDTHMDTTDTTNCTATYMPKGTTPTTYTVSFDANGGTGTMAAATGVSGEYTLPENGFTAPNGKQFKAWSVDGNEKAVGDKITVTANTTVTAVWEDIPVVTYTVSGTATSFGSQTDDMTIQLIKSGESEAAYGAIVKGNTASYSIAGVAPGTYTMKVMKQNHVTREYTVTVGSSNVVQDVEIWLLGDVTGDGVVDISDATQIKRKYNGKTSIFGSADAETETYRLIVANVYSSDDSIDITDAAQIKRYYNGKSSIFDSIP